MEVAKRPYLRADDRHRQLLSAANVLFARDGLSGLTMVALAEEAGVSRRLVYDHFADLPALFHAFFDDRAVVYRASIDTAFAAAGGDTVGAVTRVFQSMLAIPVDDQRAIRMLVAGVGPPELESVRDELRAQALERWLPLVGDLHVDAKLVGAVIWALSGSILMLAELVGRGELGPEAATALVSAIVTNLPQHLADALRRDPASVSLA